MSHLRQLKSQSIAADLATGYSEKRKLANWADNDPIAPELVEQSRARQARSLAARERISRWISAVGFMTAAIAVAVTVPSDRPLSLGLAAMSVLLYAVAYRVEFEVGSGTAVAAQLALVPMLLLLPVPLVPLLVALGAVVARVPRVISGEIHAERLTAPLASCWYVLGPAAVLVAAGEPSVELRNSLWFVAALATQFTADFATTTVREWWALAIPPRRLVQPMAWVFLVDAALAPIGLAIAFMAASSEIALLLALPLLGLIAIFAREREVRIDRTLELSNAYRGTAFLLGDVVEADDAYTGSHSRDVVQLVIGVCDRLGLDERTRQKAEFAALLHDVGKISIPSEIINKRGALTPAERAIIKTHTIEGERLLERVGGYLAEIGRIVRSSHEFYDGSGYPDGLKGDEIPLIARIVSCCDAFNAMTTDRPYRDALSRREAIAELRAKAGTQFDPAVVGALVPLIQCDVEPLPHERQLAVSSA
jgi:HD-GYP domain-containing protein (c-di-GMP phosphodiesterase class II)